MTTRFKRSIALACLATMAGTGCYSYAPVRVEEVTAGTVARARVDADEARRIADVVGREDRLLEGEVLQADGDRLLIAVPVTTTSAGTASRQFHQRVEVPTSSILEVETRQFSPLKTALIVGGGLLLTGAALAAAFAATDDSDGNEKPRPERIVVPIFRFE